MNRKLNALAEAMWKWQQIGCHDNAELAEQVVVRMQKYAKKLEVGAGRGHVEDFLNSFVTTPADRRG